MGAAVFGVHGAGDAGAGDREGARDHAERDAVVTNGQIAQESACGQRVAPPAGARDLTRGDLEGVRHTRTQAGKEAARIRARAHRLGGQPGERGVHELAAAQHTLIALPALAPAREPRHDDSPAGTAAHSAAVQIDRRARLESRTNDTRVIPARRSDLRTKLGEDEVDILRRTLTLAEEHGVSRPWIAVEGIDGDLQARTDRVEVDIANQLEQRGVFFDQDALESVLEAVTGSTMDPVNGGGIGPEPTLREAREAERPGAQQCMRMVGHESPGIEGSAGLDDERSEAFAEALTVAIGAEDSASLDAADDEVVQRTGIIKARPAGHGRAIMNINELLVK